MIGQPFSILFFVSTNVQNLGLMKCYNAHEMRNESEESDSCSCLVFACVT